MQHELEEKTLPFQVAHTMSEYFEIGSGIARQAQFPSRCLHLLTTKP